MAHKVTKNSYKFVEQPVGKSSVVIFRRTQEDNIKINLKGLGGESVNWTYLALDRD